ncbi:MAG: hypothetical protein JJ913_13985 [Rhizobiaceae bacterium]|nr:hypothetical protein [Rhizobiaceae bacterium]
MDSYFRAAAETAAYSFSCWQREPASPSFGCFDRQYWGWKKKDLPDAALQAAITIALRFAEAKGQTSLLSGAIEGYIAFMEHIQLRDGSFDQMYPNERAPGVVHDILSSLIWLWRSGHTDGAQKQRLEKVMARAVAYALQADEKHGEIANHFAHYAWELIHYGKVFSNETASARGHNYLERTLKLFHPKEGWFREYDGPDAGYQTRALAFLSKIADLTDDGGLWDVVKSGARFVEACLMPDNSLHPMLGVRSTALCYPSGFERIAARFDEFGDLADRIHDSWLKGKVTLPSKMDFENGLRIADDAFDASDIRQKRLAGRPATEAPNPTLGSLDLRDAGLHRRALGANRTLHVASRLGGVAVVYETSQKRGASLRHEDAGYLLQLSDGSRWVSRFAGSGEPLRISEAQLSVKAGFTRALHEDLTPLKLIILRLLNLTVLRFQWVGDVFRKIVVRRLISGQERLPLTFVRTIDISSGKVAVADTFSADDRLRRKLTGARLFRCRRTIANHMASSRYFQIQELESDQPWTEELSAEVLDGRTIEYVVK